jgi:hypothetical protein
VENTAGQQFTYKVSGRNATFLGMEDLHDSSYDKYQVSAEHQAFLEQANYHGLPLDDEHITYSIRVYPSSELEAEYKTNAPIVYACCVFLVFLLAAATFLTYDIYVEKRQKILYNTAIKSTAVVSSLFPESVQKRLMSEVDTSSDPKTKKETFLNGKTLDTSFDPKSRPIADLFPEATIMFAGKGYQSEMDLSFSRRVLTPLRSLIQIWWGSRPGLPVEILCKCLLCWKQFTMGLTPWLNAGEFSSKLLCDLLWHRRGLREISQTNSLIHHTYCTGYVKHLMITVAYAKAIYTS